MLKVMTTAPRMMMMICGDCNIDGAADFSCSHAYTVEYSALLTLGWMESSGWAECFREGNRWEA